MPQSTPLNLAIISPSGAGKGTHAKRLSSRFRLRHVATGDLFRANLQDHTALGILARKHMEHGELVPDCIVDAMIEAWFDQLPPELGMLLDGFPRTTEQSRFLDEQLHALGRPLDAVIYLQVSDAEIVRRLAGRLICRQCQAPFHREYKPPRAPGLCDECGGPLYQRPDDSTDMVNARIHVFHRMTEPVIEHYAAQGKLTVLSGEGAITDVDRRLEHTIDGIRDRTHDFATSGAVGRIVRTPQILPLAFNRAKPTTDIVFLGGPGSGKGTQASRLCTQLGLPHIATGDLFRDNLRLATDLGTLAKSYMDRGELVPDDVTEAMVAERLTRPDVHSGFILDGFPRSLPQAEALTEMLGRLERRLAGVVSIKVSDDALVARLSGRLICRKCQAPYHTAFKPPHREGLCDLCGGELYQRSDDHPDTVRARLVTYHRQTEPLIAYYRSAGLLHEIDGEDQVSEITRRLYASIRSFAPNLELERFASTR